MLRLPIRFALLFAASALACLPAQAETLEQLDALSDTTTSEASGIALAREQAQQGAYLEALSSLERVLAAFPRSAEGLLLHANYLCAVDDRQGGLIELQLLRERDHDARQWSDAQASCAGLTATASGPAVMPSAPPASAVVTAPSAPVTPPASPSNSANSSTASAAADSTKPKAD